MSAKDELKKLLPIIKLLKNNFPSIIISIDTFWAKTAHETIEAGADIINDISAGEMDKNMFKVIAKHNAPYIIMHMQGTPQNMQKNPTYNNIHILKILKPSLLNKISHNKISNATKYYY